MSWFKLIDEIFRGCVLTGMSSQYRRLSDVQLGQSDVYIDKYAIQWFDLTKIYWYFDVLLLILVAVSLHRVQLHLQQTCKHWSFAFARGRLSNKSYGINTNLWFHQPILQAALTGYKSQGHAWINNRWRQNRQGEASQQPAWLPHASLCHLDRCVGCVLEWKSRRGDVLCPGMFPRGILQIYN